MNNFIQCLSAFVACIGFSLIFRIHHQLRFVLVSSFSEIAARIFKAPATIFLIIGCFPLVPGRGIYQTMLYCTQGNTALFIDSFIHTIAISASLALAIMIVSTIFKVIKKFSKYSLKVNL